MASALADKILRIASRTSPEQIYTYNVGKLIKYGSWCLAVTFATYGQTFADWSLTSTAAMYEREKEEENEEESPWYRSPELLLAGRSTASVLLSAIPITLSLSVLYLTSRVVTKIHYIPGRLAQCQFTRRSIFGRDVIETVPLKDIRLRQKKRIFTGNGLHGIDDKATLAFFVTDSRKSLRKGLYIVNRSGAVKDNDGRILDIILGGTSVEAYEKNDNANDTARKSSLHTTSILEETGQRPKMQGINTRKIVLNKK